MINFCYYVPTRIWFGEGQIGHLSELEESGRRVLLVYGAGSIKKMGIYDEALRLLKRADLTVFELSGVEPNPRVELVRRGISLCREENIQMVLAIGGGSCIDTAKAIAAGTCYEGDVWDLVENSSLIQKALPIYAVLTLSATGSEMNKNAVLSDLSRNLKKGMSSDLLKPKMAICDPTYTYSVSPRQTAAGTADIISHTFENYFSSIQDSYLSSRFGEGVLRTCFTYGPIAMREPRSYEARANLMWASTNAINGIVKMGQDVGWSCHPMEHELSAFYDVVHGEGLAILTPRWMEHVLKEETLWRFVQYGRNVWGLTEGGDMAIARKSIEKTAEFFFDTLKLPSTLTQLGIGEEKLELMAERCTPLKNAFVPLEKQDVLEIYRACL